MEILMTDVSWAPARTMADELREHGYVVHTCRDEQDPDAPSCTALRHADCPLDRYPIDAAVVVGSPPSTDHLADAGLCALRRRIPVVLVDRPGDRLEAWASDSTTRSRAIASIGALEGVGLPGHTAEARRTLDEELTRQGRSPSEVGVVVRRRNGGLLIELSPHESLRPHDTERLAVHVAQRVRAFDPWARTIDVTVESTDEPHR